jgi:hypothetical protein
VLHRELEYGGVLHDDGLYGEKSRAEAVAPGRSFIVEEDSQAVRVVDRDAMFCSRASQVWEYLAIVAADAQKAVRRLFGRLLRDRGVLR